MRIRAASKQTGPLLSLLRVKGQAGHQGPFGTHAERILLEAETNSKAKLIHLFGWMLWRGEAWRGLARHRRVARRGREDAGNAEAAPRKG